MRILYVLQAVQHPTMRGSLRHYHFLRSLARRHRITLIALTRETLTTEAWHELERDTECALVFSENRTARGGRVARWLGRALALRRMRHAFGRLASSGDFDLILFHGENAYPVIKGATGLPIVADLCDATAMRHRLHMQYARGADRFWCYARYLSVRHVEREVARQASQIAFISERDRTVALRGARQGSVIPNGVDTAYWTRSCNHDGSCRIIFTGVMDYAPNEDAALFLMRSVLPRLLLAAPDVEVLIVGRNPRRCLVETARQCERVTITGFVEDMRPWLERATVFVAPLRFAAGVQNKVLEAMAMEVPVVTTPIVAAGLRVDGAEPPIEIAATAARLAERTLFLLQDSAARARRAAQGRAYVHTHFDWDHSGALLDELCLQAASSRVVPFVPNT